MFLNMVFKKVRAKFLQICNLIKKFLQICNLIKKWPFFSSIIAGLIAKPAFTSHELSFCLILSFEIFLIVLQGLFEKKKYLKSFFVGYVFGFFLYCGILYWETYLHDLKMPGLSIFKYIFYFIGVFYEAFYYASTTFLSVRLAKNKISLLIYFAIFLTLGEILNSYFFDGFPFTIIGYGTIGIPYFPQIATIFGSYGTSFFFVLILGLLNLAKYWKIGIFLLFSIITYGLYLVNLKNDYLKHHNKFEITLGEPNFNYKKRERRGYKANCDEIANLAKTNRFSSKNQKRLIIAPENVIWCQKKPIDYFIKSIAVNENTYACTGFMEWLKKEGNKDYKLYNSMHIYNNKGESVADSQKSHLLMFSEKFPTWVFKFKWIPIQSIRNWLEIIESNNMREGEGLNSVKISGIDQFAANICYDIICPGKSMKDPLLSTWILNIVNLHCYCSEKISDLAHQQNVNCRFRAIEFGKPVAVCANYGYTCIIDCNGNIIKSLKPDQIGAIHQKFPLKYQITPFCFYGQSLILILLILLFLLIFFVELLKKYNISKFIKSKKKL